MRKVSFFQVSGFVWSYYRRFRVLVFLAYLSVTVTFVVDLLNPVIMGWIVDTITVDTAPLDQRFQQAFLLVLLLFGQGILFHVSYRLGHFFNCYSDSGVEKLVAVEALDHIEHFSSDWHANTFAGANVTKIKRAMRAAHVFYDNICYDLYPTFGIVTGLIVLSSLRQPLFGLIFGIFTVLYLILSITLSIKYIAPANRAANFHDNKIGGTLADIISSNATVKSFGGEDRELGYFRQVAEEWMRAARTSWLRGNIVALLQSFVMSALKFLVLSAAIWFWYRGLCTPGDTVFILSSYMLLTGYMRNIGDRIRDMNQAMNDMEDVIIFSRTPPSVLDRPHAKNFQVKKGEITLEQVTFGYPAQGQNVYKDLSLTIRPGEKVALVGHSGSGKSTFVKLIQRLYDVQSGKILIDGQDISRVTQKSLRQHIALVPQDPILFHRSLAENIAYGKPNATMKEIETAARQAHAYEFIKDLPRGYNTLVGERGIKLSGGERQRVAIARAILADCPILILDEATSSLDSHSEQMIQDALAHLLQRRTAIIIAHRLSTVKSVDRILVFEHGMIVEEGSHAQLLRRHDGIYKKLYHLQAGGFFS